MQGLEGHMGSSPGYQSMPKAPMPSSTHTRATHAERGVPLPLSGMKTSTGLLKGPTPPLVTAATRTEHVALVATTGSRAVLLFCWASEEMFCWGREETSLGWGRRQPVPTSWARQE